MTEAFYAETIKLISTVHRKTQMYLNERLHPLGLTSGLTAFVMIPCELGRIGQNKFCEILDMDKSTVAKTLMKVEEMGYVRRCPNPEDSRSFDVFPTQKARDIYPALERIGEDWAALLSEGMTDVERTVFHELLRKLAHNSAAYFAAP